MDGKWLVKGETDYSTILKKQHTNEQPIECVLLVDTMIIQLELNKISYYFLHISHGKEEKHHSV